MCIRDRSDDKTIVISTHQVRDIDKVLDHVLIMDTSRVLLDESPASICSKLFFLESDDRELAAPALYTLPSVQGNFLMLPNTEGEESEINLELLFGAVLAAVSYTHLDVYKRQQHCRDTGNCNCIDRFQYPYADKDGYPQTERGDDRSRSEERRVGKECRL